MDGYETGRATELPTSIETRDALGKYLLRVLSDFRRTGASEWENHTLERFLDGLSRFVVDTCRDQEPPTWQAFADIIHAATGYE